MNATLSWSEAAALAGISEGYLRGIMPDLLKAGIDLRDHDGPRRTSTLWTFSRDAVTAWVAEGRPNPSRASGEIQLMTAAEARHEDDGTWTVTLTSHDSPCSAHAKALKTAIQKLAEAVADVENLQPGQVGVDVSSREWDVQVRYLAHLKSTAEHARGAYSTAFTELILQMHENGLTQSEIALLIGHSQPYINRVLKTHGKPQ